MDGPFFCYISLAAVASKQSIGSNMRKKHITIVLWFVFGAQPQKWQTAINAKLALEFVCILWRYFIIRWHLQAAGSRREPESSTVQLESETMDYTLLSLSSLKQ